MEADSNLLPAVLDTIIPAEEDGPMPGAGAIGLADTVRETLGAHWPSIAEALEALNQRARETGGTGFSQLDDEARTECLARSAESHPDLLPSLIFHTYTAYYQSPQVLEALGLEARPPYPQGYELEWGDPELLGPVQRRAPFYREVN